MWRWICIVSAMPAIVFAEVGSITEFDGSPAYANRNKEELVFEEVGFGIEMLDKLITAQTNLGITFEDGSRVKITEQSELIIDDFVYDTSTGTGRVNMQVAIGTVQMTSGRIAKTSRENVRIGTPTASITVRGTDFAMTVDEFGRSLVILLPSCLDDTINEDDCPVGTIAVSNRMGSVTLTKAYEGTMVSSNTIMPSEPRKLLLDKNSINNNLIIVPPDEFPNGFAEVSNYKENQTALDLDFFKYQDLSKDFLQEDLLEFSELDINRLDGEYLNNFLDLDLDSELSNSLEQSINEKLPTINKYPWMTWVVNEEFILLESDRPSHIAVVKVSADAHGTYDLTQDEYSADIQIQNGSNNVSIRVVQKQ